MSVVVQCSPTANPDGLDCLWDGDAWEWAEAGRHMSGTTLAPSSSSRSSNLHYDDEGYVIQWARGFIPSNSSPASTPRPRRRRAPACWRRRRRRRQRLRRNQHRHPVKAIIRRLQKGGGRGLVLMAGVQTNQFPRAADLAREFRAAGIAVAVGGFHVSGCMSMLPELPPDVRALQAEGVTLFAGEAEGRMDQLLTDAFRGEMPPIYNFLKDLPDLRGQPMPFLPPDTVRRCLSTAPFDAGRGCLPVQLLHHHQRPGPQVALPRRRRRRAVGPPRGPGHQPALITDDDLPGTELGADLRPPDLAA